MPPKPLPPPKPVDPTLVLVARSGVLEAPTTADSLARPLDSLLARHAATLRPAFDPRRKATAPAASASSLRNAEAPTPESLAQLQLFYHVTAPPDRIADLAGELREHDDVETAYLKPPVYPAQFMHSPLALPDAGPPPAVTPDFTSRQGYLDPAPGGVDARFAWTRPGGGGAGIRIIDVEGAWQFTHEDLRDNQGGLSGGRPTDDIHWRMHGTAVLGVCSGDRNNRGVTGISPDAHVRAVSRFGLGTAQAIQLAADLLDPGDILLIELHQPGPRFNFAVTNGGQDGFIAVEWWPDNLAAIRYAVAKGVIVVEAAGNGAENLDDPIYDINPDSIYGHFPADWSNPFRRRTGGASSDSGAILVGAGAPPPGTHGHDWGPDRSRLDFSNFGSAVDVQGWGREVTTCGYGLLQGGDSEDLWYTDEFSGTSSASPVIVGVLACIQGALRASGNRTQLAPAAARALLRDPANGSPQVPRQPGQPLLENIGNRPDLRAIFTSLGL